MAAPPKPGYPPMPRCRTALQTGAGVCLAYGVRDSFVFAASEDLMYRIIRFDISDIGLYKSISAFSRQNRKHAP